MEATDFKIGNWIVALGKDWEITAINKKTVTARHTVSKGVYENQTIKYCHIQPILLNATWLRHFDVKIMTPLGIAVSGAIYLSYKGIGFYCKLDKYHLPIGERVYNDKPQEIIFQYVHEFQNIFSFTDKK